MTTRRSPRLSERKQPQQTRSAELVAAILQAGAQVLAQEGATRFTTARVAEKAGVSIGSLYQYSVSYTHLDVYKRQVSMRTSSVAVMLFSVTVPVVLDEPVGWGNWT